MTGFSIKPTEFEENTITPDKYYLLLQTDELLDVTTVTKENLNVTAAGASAPAVGDVRYFPLTKQIRLQLEKSDDEDILSKSYSVNASGIKDIYGNSVSFSENLSPVYEDSAEPFGVSLTRFYFTGDGKILNKQPASGDCEAVVRILNTATKDKNVSLRIYGKDYKGNTREIYKNQFTVNADGVYEKSYPITIGKGERIYVSLTN